MFSLNVFGIFLLCCYVATFLATRGCLKYASLTIGSLGGIILKKTENDMGIFYVLMQVSP